MRIEKRRGVSGQSLIEALVAVGIVMLLITGLVVATTATLRFGQMSKDRTQALQYVKEGLEIVRIIKEKNWNDIPQGTETTCIDTIHTVFQSCPEPIIDSTFTRTVLFSDDGTTCTAVGSCRKVTVTVSWAEGSQTRSVTLSTYVTNWKGNP